MLVVSLDNKLKYIGGDIFLERGGISNGTIFFVKT